MAMKPGGKEEADHLIEAAIRGMKADDAVAIFRGYVAAMRTEIEELKTRELTHIIHHHCAPSNCAWIAR